MTYEPTIHVIDDDPAILASLSLLLTAEGYAVHTHQSAQTFLDTIRQSDSGCVVTDIHMPEINGLDLLATMNERRVSMPVIMITGQGNAQLAVAAMLQGAFDFFQKPFKADILLASIRRALMCGAESRPPAEFRQCQALDPESAGRRDAPQNRAGWRHAAVDGSTRDRRAKAYSA